jgi:sodium pump decarboxylase gamma subunit
VSEIWQGLSLSVLGLGITFAALGLLILTIILLQRIFRTRKLVPEKHEPGDTPVVSSLARDMEDEEIVAAIAVALAYLRSLELNRSGLGTSLEKGRGSWWTMGNIRRRNL